jgi:flagellar basal-body rod protein FlgB
VTITTDSVFGLNAPALALWQRRSEVIASNLANADTPGYQARDLDFRSALQQASGESNQLQLSTPTAGQIQPNGSDAEQLKYRTPMQPSMDGNTVDTQVEQAAFAANTVHYQASLSFINGSIQTLRLAINGGMS